MQKLPEAPNRKYGRRMREKKKNRRGKRRNPFLFQQWTAKSKRLNLPCC